MKLARLICPIFLGVSIVSAQLNDSRPVVVFLGDSITAGFGLPPGSAFPEQLQKLMPTHRMVNGGVSGDTTGNGLDRLNGLLALKPKLVVVELGGNDGLRGTPVDATRANLTEIVSRVKKSGAAVLLVGMTLPATYGAAYIRSFEKIYSEIAEREKIVMFPLRVLDARLELLNDGIHPTLAGQTRIARDLLSPIQKILK
jgi:acyl-CoA thioesterase-1